MEEYFIQCGMVNKIKAKNNDKIKQKTSWRGRLEYLIQYVYIWNFLHPYIFKIDIVNQLYVNIIYDSQEVFYLLWVLFSVQIGIRNP